MSIAQGWYTDPWDAGHFRWWDGATWTAHQQPKQAVAAVAVQAAPSLPVTTATPSTEASAAAQLPASTRPDLRDRVPAQSLLERFAESHGLGRLPGDTTPRMLAIDEPTRMNYLGVVGERRVAELLASLPAEWTVLHSVPTGASTGNIDHVVVGPAGVFTINVRNHPGASVTLRDMVLSVDKRKQHCLLSTVNDADRAAKELSKAVGFSVPVTGAIVFVGAKQIDDSSRSGHAGAQLWRDDDLIRNLAAAPRRLEPAQLAAVVSAAVRPGTWHVRPRLHSDAAPLVRDFGLLEQAVELADRRAAVRSRLVVLGATIAAVAAVAAIAWPFVSSLL